MEQGIGDLHGYSNGQWLTLNEAAAMIGLAVSRIQAAVEDGVIAGWKEEGKWQLQLSSVIKYGDGHNEMCSAQGLRGATRTRNNCPYCDARFRSWVGLKLHIEDQHEG